MKLEMEYRFIIENSQTIDFFSKDGFFCGCRKSRNGLLWLDINDYCWERSTRRCYEQNEYNLIFSATYVSNQLQALLFHYQ